jgi:hypothetical protein
LTLFLERFFAVLIAITYWNLTWVAYGNGEMPQSYLNKKALTDQGFVTPGSVVQTNFSNAIRGLQLRIRPEGLRIKNLGNKQKAEIVTMANYQFWRKDNQAKEVYSPAFTITIELYHNNPVEAGLVEEPKGTCIAAPKPMRRGIMAGLLTCQEF